MSRRLCEIKDWLPLAYKARWSVGNLAKLCGVSVRTLEIHFLENMRKRPKKCLLEHRQKEAIELLRAGWSVKEVAGQLGYDRPTHFSREFKKYWGFRPREARSRAPKKSRLARFGPRFARFGRQIGVP